MAANIYFDRLNRIYDERRFENHRIEVERKEEIYAAIPEYRELDMLLASPDVLDITQILNKDSTGLKKTKESIEQIDLRKRELLVEHGYPADYLDRIFTCKDCHDTGFVGEERCHCYKKELGRLLYEGSNIAQYIETDNFDNFVVEYYPDDYVTKDSDMTPRDNIQRIIAASRTYIDTFGEECNNIFIYGKSGVGKTFLSHCIAGEILKKGYSVIYLPSYQLFNILGTNVFKHDELDDYSAGVISVLYICDLLIIDDLGTELVNKFTEVQLFTLIQERINNNVSTIISTNLSFDDINNIYSERIFSRLTGYYNMFKITGVDIRIIKALS